MVVRTVVRVEIVRYLKLQEFGGISTGESVGRCSSGVEGRKSWHYFHVSPLARDYPQ